MTENDRVRKFRRSSHYKKDFEVVVQAELAKSGIRVNRNQSWTIVRSVLNSVIELSREKWVNICSIGTFRVEDSVRAIRAGKPPKRLRFKASAALNRILNSGTSLLAPELTVLQEREISEDSLGAEDVLVCRKRISSKTSSKMDMETPDVSNVFPDKNMPDVQEVIPLVKEKMDEIGQNSQDPIEPDLSSVGEKKKAKRVRVSKIKKENPVSDDNTQKDSLRVEEDKQILQSESKVETKTVKKGESKKEDKIKDLLDEDEEWLDEDNIF